MLRVRLIGVPCISDEHGRERAVRGHKSWALLARLLMAERPLTRRELATELFPETVDPLGSLRWCLAGLRRALGEPEILTGDPVVVALPDHVEVDVLALRDGRLWVDDTGQLLDGIDPACGPELSTWLLVARQQVAAQVAARIREETLTALVRGRAEQAVQLAELAARRDPYDESSHVLLVKSLVAAGHPEVAAAHIDAVERLFRAELGIDPSPALRSAGRVQIDADPPGVPAGALAETELDAGRAALEAGAVEAGVDAMRRACAHAESAGDDALLMRCWLELGGALVHSLRGFDDEGVVLLQQAMDLAERTGDITAEVTARRESAYVDVLMGRRSEAQRALQLARDRAGDDPALRAGVVAVNAFNLADWGRHDEANTEYEAALELARAAGDRRREGWVRVLGAWAHLRAGRFEPAIDWATEGRALLHDLRWMGFAPWPTAVLAEANLCTGSATSLAELERAFATSCQLGDPCWQGANARALALHHAAAGQVHTALEWITEARSRATSKCDTWVAVVGEILFTESELRAIAGDDRGAESAARETVAFAARAQLDDLLSRALALMHR